MFNPDEYLAQTAPNKVKPVPFNPDEYLAKTNPIPSMPQQPSPRTLKDFVTNKLPPSAMNFAQGMADMTNRGLSYFPKQGVAIGRDIAQTLHENKSVIDPNYKYKVLGQKLMQPIKHPIQATAQLLQPANEMAKGLIAQGEQIASDPGGSFYNDPIGTTAFVAPFVPKVLKTTGAIAEGSSALMKNSAGRLVNSIIKPLKKDFSYGKNAGEGVVREGIMAKSFDDLMGKISQKASEIGNKIHDIVSDPANSTKVINNSKIILNIDDAIAQANKSPRTNSALLQRLDNAKSDILGIQEVAPGEFSATRDLTQMTPLDTFELKRQVADITKWTGNESDDALVNKALKRTYGQLKENLNKAVPGLKDLNERYANIKTADMAIQYRNKILQRQNALGLFPKMTLGGGVLASLVSGNPVGAIGGAALAGAELLGKSTPFKTGLAQGLYKAGTGLENATAGIKRIGGAMNTPLIIADNLKKNFQILKNERGAINPGEVVPLSRMPKQPMPIRLASGEKTTITPKPGEQFSVKQIFQDNKPKFQLTDGDKYMIPKNTAEDLVNKFGMRKTGSFAPELKGVEEVVKGDVQSEKLNQLEQELQQARAAGNRERIQAIQNEANILGEKYGHKDTKFSQYTEPGGENYREVLIKAKPEKSFDKHNIKIGDEIQYGRSTLKIVGDDFRENGQFEAINPIGQKVTINLDTEIKHGTIQQAGSFKSSHWDEPNVIAHVRMNDRVTPDGKKVLFLEEIQSDWARKAREGAKSNYTVKALNPREFIVQDSAGEEVGLIYSTKEKAQLSADFRNKEGFPSHPLLKNWQELTLKRALQEAVKNGDDYLAWTSGEQQAARYDLSKHLDTISAVRNRDMSYSIQGMKNGNLVIDKIVSEADLPNTVGKDLAEKISNNHSVQSGNVKNFPNQDLKIGGEWAKNLYDRQIPNILKDLTKGEIVELKMSGLSGKSPMTAKDMEIMHKNDGVMTQQALRITPEIRAMVLGKK
jgi:hypothetical protein